MTNEEYKQKKRECLQDFCKEHCYNITPESPGIFGYAFDRAYALAIQNSDAVWEKNMAETLKMLDEMTSKFGFPEEDVLAAAEWIKDVTYDVLQGIMKPETISLVIKFTKLHSNVSDKGTTCTPVEDDPNDHTDHIVQGNDMVDTLIQRGFRDHNRLHIAAMAMQGMLSNPMRFSSYEISDLVRISLNCADALIAECEKGGDPC